MKVRALKKILYKGEIYEAGSDFEMDEVSAGIAKKYNNIDILCGGGEEELTPASLPPLNTKKK